MERENFLRIRKIAKDEIDFNEDNVMEKCLLVPNYHQKYLDLWTVEVLRLENLKSQIDKKYGKIFHDLKKNGVNGYEYDNKAEKDIAIKSDDEYYKLVLKRNELEMQVQFFESVLSNIKNMSFIMKTYIEIKKFKTGRDY